ncbi:nucleotide sugar dehydrogenase|uniref:UDP-N-acetyl-D-galactosamine dehydrogenase n=1 Tax=Dendrosporobacter quercicolus TaxID=146817 RepID=A0A1H0AVS7_9FIRM|nr:nucleotide sugar dehydrogenase [Dendrosporobacter quercicolus]NSL50109.1 nucleotide sugar dehydrogenase [Dendrosporobacter quercicolus DSM 1736]SDN37465.1 UDP-N-acetyl-D-galactosamine dehydrogenase [Dendrosporobacter quercicolus]
MQREILKNLQAGRTCLAVVGLGYVGLPIAVAFAGKVKTLGFDINRDKIRLYRQGIDPTREIGDEQLSGAALEFTADPARLKQAQVIIVAVPTPVNGDKTPDLTPVIQASRLIGQNLSPGSIVIFESTVYPGVTEEICTPILEHESGLVCGKDFSIGYSPERINPGDKAHKLQNITKIVAGMNDETREIIAAVYGLIITAGVYKASSIQVAEAAKLAENAQRDINIAFMNELAMAFDRMGINTKDVIDAMNTKWNALGFYPGLVGGHCIGVDPYYFIYQAEMLGYHSQLIAAGRRVNDSMAGFVSDHIIKRLLQSGKNVGNFNLYVLGITFKENCPDMRNSKALEVCRRLGEYGVSVKVVDPVVDQAEFRKTTGLELVSLAEVKQADCLAFLVAHEQFKELRPTDLAGMFNAGQQTKRLIVDLKSIFEQQSIEAQGYSYWSL